ncbi:MAG: ACT domain-containing protein [bacterium]
MHVKQISVFLENRSGRLAEVTRALRENNVNIRALSLADTSDFGILRLIVNDVPRALSALRKGGFTVSETDVIAVEVPDRPGGLAGILDVLEKAGLNVEYMYAFVEKSGDKAIMIFRFEEIDRAIQALQKGGITVLKGEKVYGL